MHAIYKSDLKYKTFNSMPQKTSLDTILMAPLIWLITLLHSYGIVVCLDPGTSKFMLVVTL